jgi:hypothetical protein
VASYAKLKLNKITETDWENVIDAEDDINSACSNFTKAFLNITKTCIPTYKNVDM